MSKIICLTGGIGSGKTTVANYLLSKNIPVYIADTEAKKLLDLPEVQRELQKIFGENIFENSAINRVKLANIVFSNPEKLKELNQIIHPKVKIHFKNWVNEHKKHPILVREAAVLFESGNYKDCETIILLKTPEHIRIQRVIERDQTTAANVQNRIKNQWTDEEKEKRSNFVVENINLTETLNKIDNILNLIENN